MKLGCQRERGKMGTNLVCFLSFEVGKSRCGLGFGRVHGDGRIRSSRCFLGKRRTGCEGESWIYEASDNHDSSEMWQKDKEPPAEAI